MTVSNITAGDVRAKIKELAAERPTYTYVKPKGAQFCLYVHEDSSGAPIKGEGCIVGQALVALGVDPNTLVDVFMDAESLLYDFGINDNSESGTDAEWVEKAQSAQDFGKEWAVAVEAADEYEADRLSQYTE